MKDTADRNVNFVSKLVELTQKKRISWTSHPQGGYVTKAFGRDLRAVNVPHSIQGNVSLPFVTPVLEVFDQDGKVGYTFEGIAGLRDLVSLAAYHATRVEDLIEDVLAS